MFELMQQPNLVGIAAAGGGFRMNASLKPTPELVSIAAAGAIHGARITLIGLQLRPVQDLIAIAAAGKGCIEFADV